MKSGYCLFFKSTYSIHHKAQEPRGYKGRWERSSLQGSHKPPAIILGAQCNKKNLSLNWPDTLRTIKSSWTYLFQFTKPEKWEGYTKIPISHKSAQTSFLIQHTPCNLFPCLKFIAINTEHEKCEMMPVQPSLWPRSFAKFMHVSSLFKWERATQTRLCSSFQ